jgi:transcription elongation GreA/GreB family factor
MDKEAVHSHVITELKRRFNQLQYLLNDALEATAGDTKSSAGDKHETSRAMAQLEQEKIGAQLGELSKLQEILFRIDPTRISKSIQLGSLVETTKGWFYVSVGIGQINFEGTSIFCITPMAPLCKILMGKSTGDAVDWQGEKITVLNCF